MAGLAYLAPSSTIAIVQKKTKPAAERRDPMADPNFDMRQRDVHGVQGSLFPDDELIVPESIRTMRKAVSAIHAVPVKAEHTQSLNSRRLFDACIIVAQVECRGREAEIVKRLKEDRISPMFEVRISHLAELAGVPGKNYQRLYDELDKLFELVLAFNILAEDGEVQWEMKSHFFSALGYGKNYKKGMVRFAFDASVLELFLEPSIWAKLSMEVMGGLRTATSYSLYQQCWRYAGTQNKVTAALPTHIWCELLVGKSRYVTEEKDGRKTVQYGDFKRRVLDPAMAIVNECSALGYTLELKEIRSGNRVAKLQFRFVPKQVRQQSIPLSWPSDVVEVLGKLGYGTGEIHDLSQAHSYVEVAEAVNRLAAAERRHREQGKAITSRRSYLEGILRNISGGATGDQLDDEKIEAEIRAQEAKQAAEERMTLLRTQFQDHQRRQFASWYAELPGAQRESLVKEFLASPDLSTGDKIIVKQGVSVSNYSGQALLRNWMVKHHADLLDTALPLPEDKSFENWMAWRLAGGDVVSEQSSS